MIVTIMYIYIEFPENIRVDIIRQKIEDITIGVTTIKPISFNKIDLKIKDNKKDH